MNLFVDTPCNLKMLQWLLLLNSVKSTPAVNGYEAIVAFERAAPRFDLIFMDNTMPIMVINEVRMDVYVLIAASCLFLL